ncbi:hypothetical protein [Microbacterium sp. KNMS]
MMPRRPLALVAAIAGAISLAGCVPEPAPTPTPNGFASEEEAFAAAEETWNEYVTAVNDVDLRNADTFEPLYELTVGDFNADVREEYSRNHAEGWTTSGDAATKSFQPVSYDAKTHQVVAISCLDVSEVQAFDASGESVVDPERRDLQALEITFTLRPEKADARISDVSGSASESICE